MENEKIFENTLIVCRKYQEYRQKQEQDEEHFVESLDVDDV